MKLLPSQIAGYMMAGTALVAVAMPLAVQANDKDKDDQGTTVQLTADAHRMVAQDRVQATLGFEATGKTAQAVQDSVNTKMQAAQKLYTGVAGVKPSTGQYNVFKDYEPEPAPVKGVPAWTAEEREKHAVWHGSQDVQLDGTKSDDMLALIASLQKQGLAMRGLNFYMSRGAEDAVKDALIVEALGNIQARAANIQKALGMKSIRYAKIDLGNQAGQPMPMMARGMMMKTDMVAASPMATPVADAGETEVVVNVTAEVLLK